MVHRLVTVVSVNPFSGYEREGRGRGAISIAQKGYGLAIRQEVLGYDVDTASMIIALPVRKIDDLRARVAEWQLERQTATVKERLVLAEEGCIDNPL